VAQLTPVEAINSLRDLHTRLDDHFRTLHDRRRTLALGTPLFALEHDLSADDLETVRLCVRLAVADGFGPQYWQQSWLPIVIYAAESGYDYVGNEYWQSFELATPHWEVHGSRNVIRTLFQRFGTEYGGAIPAGAFAQNFPIIAWPITHAILPVYMQRHLAQMLYEFRAGLTPELLGHPEDLGQVLASRSWGYTERFRVFCSNTLLLGHVAAALLSGEGEDSPYLLRSTLLRLIEGLGQERQAKRWLQGARNAANHVRAHGFQPVVSEGGTATQRGRLPNRTDPRLVLRGSETGWRAYAQLPDLSNLSRGLTHVYDELRTRRARVEGAEDTVLARGRLVTPGQEIRLTSWPNSETSFIELEDGSSEVNALLRDQVEISRGPVWLFKRRAPGLAVEVKSKLIHPNNTYYIVHGGDWTGDGIPGLDPIKLDVAGAAAARLVAPKQLTEAGADALVAAGLHIVTNVVIRPVGVVPSSWDGEGAVEWIAGERGLLGIHAEQVPAGGTLSLDGEQYSLEWPEGSHELFLSLDDLSVGDHELRITLTGDARQTLTEGSLLVTIRDPKVRSDSAEVGEGIRLLASPAQPTMTEVWAPGAVAIDGPDDLQIDLTLLLRDESDRELTKISQPIVLPLRDSNWAGVANRLRADNRFKRNFDRAESLELTVARAGVGHATLHADRGFQPLRWRLLGDREEKRAQLIDLTDTGTVRVLLSRVEDPLVEAEVDPAVDVPIPPTGGLLRAEVSTGVEASATIVLPPHPNSLLGHPVKPEVAVGARTSEEVLRLAGHFRRWANADLPGDIFAQHQRDSVLESITVSLVSLVCGESWATLEASVALAHEPEDLIDEMRDEVGETAEEWRLARDITHSLWRWSDAGLLLSEFSSLAQPLLRSYGITPLDSAPRFLLVLASRPGEVSEWSEVNRNALLRHVLRTPVLLRAARLAVVGARMYGRSGP